MSKDNSYLFRDHAKPTDPKNWRNGVQASQPGIIARAKKTVKRFVIKSVIFTTVVGGALGVAIVGTDNIKDYATGIAQGFQNCKRITQLNYLDGRVPMTVHGFKSVGASDPDLFFSQYVNEIKGGMFKAKVLDDDRVRQRVELDKFLSAKNHSKETQTRVDAVNALTSILKSADNNETKAILADAFMGTILDYDFDKAKELDSRVVRNYSTKEMLVLGKGVCTDLAYFLGEVLTRSGVPSKDLWIMYLGNGIVGESGHAVLAMNSKNGPLVFDFEMWDKKDFARKDFKEVFNAKKGAVPVGEYFKKNPNLVLCAARTIEGQTVVYIPDYDKDRTISPNTKKARAHGISPEARLVTALVESLAVDVHKKMLQVTGKLPKPMKRLLARGNNRGTSPG